jgi:hypothetical protein
LRRIRDFIAPPQKKTPLPKKEGDYLKIAKEESWA